MKQELERKNNAFCYMRMWIRLWRRRVLFAKGVFWCVAEAAATTILTHRTAEPGSSPLPRPMGLQETRFRKRIHINVFYSLESEKGMFFVQGTLTSQKPFSFISLPYSKNAADNVLKHQYWLKIERLYYSSASLSSLDPCKILLTLKHLR